MSTYIIKLTLAYTYLTKMHLWSFISVKIIKKAETRDNKVSCVKTKKNPTSCKKQDNSVNYRTFGHRTYSLCTILPNLFCFYLCWLLRSLFCFGLWTLLSLWRLHKKKINIKMFFLHNMFVYIRLKYESTDFQEMLINKLTKT